MGAVIKGLAWDHRRCWGPLDASIAAWEAGHPGVTIQWDRRSLYEFGEGRLDEAVKQYDLVILDHPFMGEAARGRMLVPFDDYLSAADRAAFERESVGKSWQSYRFDGRHWALPIDAASQVASYRPDLLARYGGEVPAKHGDIVNLGLRLRADGLWLGLPFVPTDALCLVITGAASLDAPIGLTPDLFIETPVLEEVVGRIREIAALSHPKSESWNPIRCYEHMIHNDDVVYVPYAFGYVNYAARMEEPHLRFANIPGTKGAILGGAGIGVSVHTQHRDAAMQYALHLCRPEFQRTEYVAAGGQPACLSAWTDEANNVLTRNFFKDTLATLQASYLRPTHPGVLPFFREATHKAFAAIKGDLPARDLADWFNRRYAETDFSAAAERSVA